jgi:hypothetical protein
MTDQGNEPVTPAHDRGHDDQKLAPKTQHDDLQTELPPRLRAYPPSNHPDYLNR